MCAVGITVCCVGSVILSAAVSHATKGTVMRVDSNYRDSKSPDLLRGSTHLVELKEKKKRKDGNREGFM